IVGGVGWWLVHQSGTRTKSSNLSATSSASPPIAPTQKSIAVLPFVNMSADKNDEYLSDGMTEELLNVLTKVKSLRVPGRSSSFAFKGRNEDNIFRKVGEQLHVNAVLEGSVRKAGDKLRITAQLINVADGFHLWSETYDGDMKDILAVQSDVAKRVVEALQVQLGVDEARALEKKPTEMAQKALALDPNLAESHLAMATALFTVLNPHAAEKELDRAVNLNPNLPLVYDQYGWAYAEMGRFDEAIAAQKKALEIDPLN